MLSASAFGFGHDHSRYEKKNVIQKLLLASALNWRLIFYSNFYVPIFLEFLVSSKKQVIEDHPFILRKLNSLLKHT